MLRSRMEGNFEVSEKYQEHLTPVQTRLNERSQANVKAARQRARREYGMGKKGT